LVTGSSRGIGFGIASSFAKQGHTVVLNGKSDEARLVSAVEELKKNYGCNATGFLTDVSNYNNVYDMFAKIEGLYGGVDVVVNSAGVAHFGLFSQTPCGKIDQIIQNNLHASLYVSQLAIPYMVRAKIGSIINITSVWGLMGASCEVAYSAAKAGIIGFTKALAKELAPSGVRVNAIACGAFETRMNDCLTTEEKAAFIESIPLGRFGELHEVGELAAFLASENAAYITGQVISLDGGLS